MLSKRYEYDGKPIWKLNSLQSEMKKQIDLKVAQRIYQFESVSCPICNGEDFETLSQKDRYGLYLNVVICKQCGLIQANPRMTKKSYEAFYNCEYTKLYRDFSPDEIFYKEYQDGANIYSFLKDNTTLFRTPSNLFIFEVGCGAGGILQYFRERGYHVQGIDLGKEYLAFGKNKYNLNLSVGTIASTLFEQQPDIIIYSHVLEHILYPKEELAHIHRILSPNGIIYIQVPNVSNPMNYGMDFSQLLIAGHTYYFTFMTLKNLLEINGFQMISGDESIKSIFKKSEPVASNTISGNSYTAVIVYLSRLERLRRWLSFLTYIIRFCRLLLPKWAIKILREFGLHSIVRKTCWKLIYRKSDTF